MTDSNQGTADFQAIVPADRKPSVPTVTTMEQWELMVKATDKASTDLVASPVVREGYMKGGHPADMGFIHLNSMTASRVKKRFPVADKHDPLFQMLYAQGKLVVGQGLVKKYEARAAGKEFDYKKWINRRFDELFDNLDKYRERLAEIKYEEQA